MADRDLVAEFDSFEEVLAGYATHLSEVGIFLQTTRPGSVGSEVAFEVKIRDSFSVLRGAGEIVQIKDDGVFLRLVYLDQPSLKLLPRIVEHYRRHGIPLLELPENESVEVEESAPARESEELEVIEKPSVDDLFDEEVRSPVPPIGLTLDDLEAEFLSDQNPADEEPEPNPVTDAKTELLEVGEVEPLDEGVEDLEVEVEKEVPGEPAVEVDSEPDEDVESFLIDPEELISDIPTDEDRLASDDIHLDTLVAAEETKDLEVASGGALSLDAGLAWLPEEPEKKSRKELWLFLALILLGAVLGAVFYFFFFKPQATSSGRTPQPAEVQIAALPAAVPVAEPVAAMAVETERPVVRPVGQTVPSDAPVEPTPEAPVARIHSPPGVPATGVDRITWALESGETVITFWGDGLFVEEQVDDFRVAGGAPREVVRIRGIRRPFAQQRIELDSDHVRQIRIGLHQESDGSSLHFVADLVDGEVELSRTEAAGEQLRVYFSKAG